LKKKINHLFNLELLDIKKEKRKPTKAQAPPSFGGALRKAYNRFYSGCLLLRLGGRGTFSGTWALAGIEPTFS